MRLACWLLLLIACSPLAASAQPRGGRGDAPDRLADAIASYKAGVERVIPMYEDDVRRLTELLARSADLYARGEIDKQDYERALRLSIAAEVKLDEARRDLQRADILLAESSARKRLLALPRPRPGEYRVAGDLIRYSGTAAWKLSDVAKISRFFWVQFGRTLPVSAIGQTPVHDRMGLDHRRGVDVALHPDSAEGRTLMSHLRELGVPFLASRGAVSGSATGAHIHIGPPSERLRR